MSTILKLVKNLGRRSELLLGAGVPPDLPRGDQQQREVLNLLRLVYLTRDSLYNGNVHNYIGFDMYKYILLGYL